MTIIKQPMFRPMVAKGQAGRKGGPRPILMADMPAATGRPRTIKEQVADYLKRLRYTLPFPVDIQETYFGCMPEAMRRWHDQGVFDPDPDKQHVPGRMLNMLYSTTILSDQAIHFSLDTREIYRKAVAGRQLGFEKVFWMQVSAAVPAPLDSKTVPLFVPEDHKHEAAVRQWHSQAMNMEEDIQLMEKVVTTYMGMADTVPAVKHTWPELLNFVTIPPGPTRSMTHAERESLKTRAAKVMAPNDKAHIITQLSTAVMIPENAARPPAAWVGFQTVEFRV